MSFPRRNQNNEDPQQYFLAQLFCISGSLHVGGDEFVGNEFVLVMTLPVSIATKYTIKKNCIF